MTIPYSQADKLASQVGDKIAPYCDQVKVCGSIRRHATDVKDIDIVCFPVITKDVLTMNLFSEPVDYQVNNKLLNLVHDGKHMDRLGLELVSGKDKKISIRLYGEDINIELYLVERVSQFGLAVLVRTGPAAATKRIMQYALERHWHITDYELHTHEKGGRPGRRTKCKRGSTCTAIADTSTELKAFNALGLDYPHPAARVPHLIEKLISQTAEHRLVSVGGGAGHDGGGAYGG
ncbi:MAG: hypothetical protein FVQ84_22810 [Planctomycetes bacterium]|nr:hypothetical protein [Planctomycetota bacterium]